MSSPFLKLVLAIGDGGFSPTAEMRPREWNDVKVIPLNVCTPRKTPIAYLEAAKAKIDSDVQLGIIKKVEGVSRWCSPMSFVPRLNGKVRSVIILRSWEEMSD